MSNLHTSCKDCFYAIYEESEKTQVGCHFNKLEKLKENNIAITESFDDEKDTRPLDWQLPSDCYGGGLAVPSTCGPIDLRTRSNSGNRT